MRNINNLMLTPWRKCMSWLPMESFVKCDLSSPPLMGTFFLLVPLLSVQQANLQVFPTFPPPSPHILRGSCCYAWSFAFCPIIQTSLFLSSFQQDYKSGQQHPKANHEQPSHILFTLLLVLPQFLRPFCPNNKYFIWACPSAIANRCSASLNKVQDRSG